MDVGGAAEKKKQGCGILSVLVLAVAFLQACGTTPPQTPKTPPPEDSQASKASRAPVISYSVVRGKEQSGQWIYVVPTARPTDQQLIDLAFDLREKFPAAYFEIVDSASAIKAIQAANDGDTTVTDAYVNQHEIAMLRMFVDKGKDRFRWKLVGPDDRTIAAFQNSPADIAAVEGNRSRGKAETDRMNLEHERCDKLKSKAIADITPHDLETISECKADGNW